MDRSDRMSPIHKRKMDHSDHMGPIHKRKMDRSDLMSPIHKRKMDHSDLMGPIHKRKMDCSNRMGPILYRKLDPFIWSISNPYAKSVCYKKGGASHLRSASFFPIQVFFCRTGCRKLYFMGCLDT